MNILGNTSEMYGDSPTVPIYLSITQWQAHEHACETFHLHFENFLGVLLTSYAKQKKAKALGLFIQGSSCQTIAINLMHLDVFKSIKSLISFFQMSKGACSVSDANTYCELCLQSLNKLKEKPNHCNSEKFNRLNKLLMAKMWPCFFLLRFAFKNLTLKISSIMYSQNLFIHS